MRKYNVSVGIRVCLRIFTPSYILNDVGVVFQVQVALGKNMEAVVVDSERAAHECIEYMKQVCYYNYDL